MDTEISGGRQSRAFAAAKLAVRRYARDPSNRNAEVVTRAWRRVRELNVATKRPAIAATQPPNTR